MGATEETVTDEGLVTVEQALEEAKAKSVFSGHPADDMSDDEDESSESVEEDGDKEEAAKPDEAEPDKKAEEEPEPKKKPKFKYASHEEAEKGAKEAERRMHEAIEEAKRMREEVEAIRKQIAESTKTGDVSKEEKAELDEMFQTMLKSIKELDADSPDYDAMLAKIWSKTIGTVTEATAKKLIEQENARRAEEAKRIAQEEQNRKMIEKTAIERAKQAGLDMDNEDSTDRELFWTLAASSVGETLEDRINWTIDRVKKIKKALVGKTLSSQEQARKAQVKNKVLERGATSARSPAVEEDRPLSISEALARTERRL